MKTLADARLPEEPSCVYCRMGAPDLCRCQQAAEVAASQPGTPEGVDQTILPQTEKGS